MTQGVVRIWWDDLETRPWLHPHESAVFVSRMRLSAVKRFDSVTNVIRQTPPLAGRAPAQLSPSALQHRSIGLFGISSLLGCGLAQFGAMRWSLNKILWPPIARSCWSTFKFFFRATASDAIFKDKFSSHHHPHSGLVERLSVTYVSNEGWALSYRFEWVKLIWCQVQQNHKNLNCWVTRHQKAKSWLLWRLKWRMTRTVEFKFGFYLIPMLSVVLLWCLCVKAVVVDSDFFLLCSPDANDDCPSALRNVSSGLMYLRGNPVWFFC